MLRNIIVCGVMISSMSSVTALAADSGTSTYSAREAAAGNSRDQQLGVGIQVGSFSGVNFEYWNTHDTSLNANLTFTRGNTAIGLAHMWMFRNTFTGEARAFVPFVGAGLLGVWANSSLDSNNNYNNDRFILAAQVPLGMEFLPFAQRFSVFAELAPSLEVTPYTVGFLTADIGARLYF